MKRKPVDLPSIVKRHFLRGLRGGGKRDSVYLLSIEDDARSHSVSSNEPMSDGSTGKVELSLFSL